MEKVGDKRDLKVVGQHLTSLHANCNVDPAKIMILKNVILSLVLSVRVDGHYGKDGDHVIGGNGRELGDAGQHQIAHYVASGDAWASLIISETVSH